MRDPPYEWPTSMAGALPRPSVRVTVATSPVTVSRLCWAATTSYPSACSVGITLPKHEPSAQIPWTNTMLGLLCLDIVRSFLRGHAGSGANGHRKSRTRRDSFSSRDLAHRNRAVISAFAETSAYASNNLGDAERCRRSGDGGRAAGYDDLKRCRA